MRIAVFSTKPYDRRFLDQANQTQHELTYFDPQLTAETTCTGSLLAGMARSRQRRPAQLGCSRMKSRTSSARSFVCHISLTLTPTAAAPPERGVAATGRIPLHVTPA